MITYLYLKNIIRPVLQSNLHWKCFEKMFQTHNCRSNINLQTLTHPPKFILYYNSIFKSNYFFVSVQIKLIHSHLVTHSDFNKYKISMAKDDILRIQQMKPANFTSEYRWTTSPMVTLDYKLLALIFATRRRAPPSGWK